MGSLSTQVIDTAGGIPAAGMAVALYRFGSMGVRALVTKTQADGQGRAVLVPAGEALPAGCYELVFQAGDYFRDTEEDLPDPPFLDEVPVRFTVRDGEVHDHLPLFISPWSYTIGKGY